MLEKMKKITILSLSAILIFFCFALLEQAETYRNVFILNHVFLNFAVISQQPQTRVDDSLIVHEGGRIDYLSDGKYILINGKSYYDWLTRTYGKEMIASSWSKAFHGDFDKDVTEYYDNREAYNISHELDLKAYWEKKRAAIVENK